MQHFCSINCNVMILLVHSLMQVVSCPENPLFMNSASRPLPNRRPYAYAQTSLATLDMPRSSRQYWPPHPPPPRATRVMYINTHDCCVTNASSTLQCFDFHGVSLGVLPSDHPAILQMVLLLVSSVSTAARHACTRVSNHIYQLTSVLAAITSFAV
jgi:hypothetical protein